MYAVPIRGPSSEFSGDFRNFQIKRVPYGERPEELTMLSLIYGTEHNLRYSVSGEEVRFDFGICTQQSENDRNFGLSFIHQDETTSQEVILSHSITKYIFRGVKVKLESRLSHLAANFAYSLGVETCKGK